jgi:hypothetical protein
MRDGQIKPYPDDEWNSWRNAKKNQIARHSLGLEETPPSISEAARSARDGVVEASSDSSVSGDFGATKESDNLLHRFKPVRR